MRLFVRLGLLAVLLLSAVQAYADPITYYFAAIGFNYDAALVGLRSTVRGSFTFESTAPDTNPSEVEGLYLSVPALLVEFSDSLMFTRSGPGGGEGYLSITNNGPGSGPYDQFYVYGKNVTGPTVNGLSPFSYQVWLNDNHGTALNSDALSLVELSLNSFEGAQFALNFGSLESHSYLGFITHLSQSPDDIPNPVPTPVPEPASLLLFGTCQVARVGGQSFSPDRGPDLTSYTCQTPGLVWGCEGPHY